MKRNSTLHLALFAAVLAATGAHAQIAINASAAAAGGVTPGDAPGYPVTLSQAGAYKLTGNLSLTSADPNSVIVHITAANVDLDLNGFTIASYNVCANTSSHYNGPGNDCLNRKIYDPLVLVEAPFARIHGGYVEGSLGDGIFIASLPSQPGGSVLDDLQVTNNRGYGISSVDDGAAVRDSLVTLNGSGGVVVARDGVLHKVRVSRNNGNGVQTGTNALIEQVTSTYNELNGIAADGGSVTQVEASFNGGDGVLGSAAVSFSRAQRNGGAGYRYPVMLTQSSASDSPIGYAAPLTGGCYGNFHSRNTTTPIQAGTGFVGTLTVCP